MHTGYVLIVAKRTVQREGWSPHGLPEGTPVATDCYRGISRRKTGLGDNIIL